MRPLKSKRAAEVSDNLVEVFGIFGAPSLLHSDNGKEFKNQITQELVKKWPGCKTVNGRPRHSQSQGSVERANQDIKVIIFK